MSKKIKEILSELATDLKAINLDDRVSFRYLHEKLNSKLEYFLRLEARSRDILKDTSIWKPIHCIDLIEAPANCCDFYDKCANIKRSKDKIPEAFNTNYGPLLKIVTVTGTKEFTLIKSIDYKDYITREYKSNKQPFWLENGYIFIPNITLETVKGLIIPKNPIEVDKLNCEATACASVLDGVINCPDYLITLAKQEVVKELLPRTNVREDERGDDNTNNKT